MITATGWTKEYCRHQVTLSFFNRLVKYWSENPPTHVTLDAVARGLSGKSKVAQKPWETESVEDLFARWQGTQGAVVGSQ